MIYVFLGFRVLSVIYACYIWRNEIEEEVELKGERERERKKSKNWQDPENKLIQCGQMGYGSHKMRNSSSMGLLWLVKKSKKLPHMASTWEWGAFKCDLVQALHV